MARTRLAALALTATTLAAAGCGSSGSKDQLTRQQLIAKADAICRRVNLEVAKNHATTKQEIAEVAPRIASIEQTAVAEMSKLVPPSDLAGDWKQLVDGARALATSTVALGEYAKGVTLHGLSSVLAQVKPQVEEMKATAKRDGFNDCSQIS